MDNKYRNTDLFKITECPSDAMLLSYVKKTISNEDKRLVELHLVDCEMCNDMVEGLLKMNPESIDTHIADLNTKIDLAVHANKSNVTVASKFKWYYAIAAILILGLTGILYQFYFSSLDSAKVADLPMPHKNEAIVKEDSILPVVIEQESEVKALEIVKAVAPVEEDSKGRDVQFDIKDQAKDAEIEAEMPAAVEKSTAEVAVNEVLINDDANALKQATEATGTAIGSETKSLSTTSFSAPVNTDVIVTGASPSFTSQNNIQESISLNAIESKNYSLKPQKVGKKDSKYKTKTPATSAQKKDTKEENRLKQEANAKPINYLSQAMNLMSQKEYAKAINSFNQHLASNPANCEAVHGLAQCYDFTNQLALALSNYIKLSKLKCGKLADQAYLKQAELHIKNNQKAEAKKVLQKAMQSKYLDVAEPAKKELDKL